MRHEDILWPGQLDIQWMSHGYPLLMSKTSSPGYLLDILRMSCAARWVIRTGIDMPEE